MKSHLFKSREEPHNQRLHDDRSYLAACEPNRYVPKTIKEQKGFR